MPPAASIPFLPGFTKSQDSDARMGQKERLSPMPLSKRLFDIACSVVLAPLLAPVMLALALLVLVVDGRPVFFVSERMRTPQRGFLLLKFRTMRPVAHDSGVSGGEKADRITRTGGALRRLRLDELPQLWNVLRGDMSLVGPRPPLRQHVEHSPELFAQVLRARPGVTGLGTLLMFRIEARLLARSRSAAETDRIYGRACLPRKAHLELIYQERRTLGLDIVILLKTLRKVFRPRPILGVTCRLARMARRARARPSRRFWTQPARIRPRPVYPPMRAPVAFRTCRTALRGAAPAPEPVPVPVPVPVRARACPPVPARLPALPCRTRCFLATGPPRLPGDCRVTGPGLVTEICRARPVLILQQNRCLPT